MDYIGYKLHFPVGVHIGNGTLEESRKTFDASHLFSALCLEAMGRSRDDLEKLIRIVKNGELLLSDAFPYIRDRLFIPKPMVQIETAGTGDFSGNKVYKALEYIPSDSVDLYMSGNMDAEKEWLLLKKGFCRLEVRTLASISGEEETLPYQIGVCNYLKDAGLYLVIGYIGTENLEFFQSLLEGLGYSGIGGKRASGFGRFSVEEFSHPKSFGDRLGGTEADYVMSLSVCLPKKEELEDVLPGASYKMVKRGGFVSSSDYADIAFRKKDIYLFQAGSCFEKPFSGDIYDVSSGGKHPVYRYAKPLFMEV